MKFYGITMHGKFINQQVGDTLVLGDLDTPADDGRLVYNEEDGFLWWGDGISNKWRKVGEGTGEASEREDMYSDLLRTSIFKNASWGEFWENMAVDPYVNETVSADLEDYWNSENKSYDFPGGHTYVLESNDIYDTNLGLQNIPYVMPSIWWQDPVPPDGVAPTDPDIYLSCNGGTTWEGPGDGVANNAVYKFKNLNNPGDPIDLRIRVVTDQPGTLLSWGVLYNKDLSVGCGKQALTTFKTTITGGNQNTIYVDYVPDNVMVFLNGDLLADDDYDASTGTEIVIDSPDLLVGDVVVIVSMGTSVGIGVGGGQESSYEQYIAVADGDIMGGSSNTIVTDYIVDKVLVSYNGFMLAVGDDFTATDGINIVIDSPSIIAGDVIIVTKL